MLSVAARAACVRFAAGASVVTAAHETDAAHCDAVRRKMTPIGAFSLLSETPAAPSIPAVLLTFKAPLAAADLKDALTAGVAPASARFRSRVDERALEFVDDLGPRGAVRRRRGAREAALPGAVAEALTAPLLGRDGAGPWWEALVFDHAARTSVLLRAHHCLADGVSLASLFARATDQAEAIAAAVDAEIAKRRRPRGERRRRSALARFASSSRRSAVAASSARWPCCASWRRRARPCAGPRRARRDGPVRRLGEQVQRRGDAQARRAPEATRRRSTTSSRPSSEAPSGTCSATPRT
ncbi:DUF1298-containing protein [Aureococcus anophagefferens]|nr:DUF1298-containing protein [Aureococcus anophagefferens]